MTTLTIQFLKILLNDQEISDDLSKFG